MRAHSEETKKKISQALIARARINIPEGHKRCYRCNQIKPFSDFCRATARRDGRHTLCKQCTSTTYFNKKAARIKVVAKKVCRDCGLVFEDLTENHSLLYCPVHRTKKAHRFRIREKRRMKVYEALGGAKCRNCGFTNRYALQIDHVFGNGAKERLNFGMSWETWYKYIIKNPDQYQILCANCNWIKRFENREANCTLASDLENLSHSSEGLNVGTN